VRLDAAGDDITAPPMTFDATILAGAFLRAVRAVQVAYPVRLEGRAQVARFGSECDVTILDTGTRAAKVARYVSKYVAKSSDTGGVLDRPLRPADMANLDKLGLSDHERRLVETAWRLGGRSELASLKLRTWTHQLGLPGPRTHQVPPLLDHLQGPGSGPGGLAGGQSPAPQRPVGPTPGDRSG